jgi:hypothetical protein
MVQDYILYDPSGSRGREHEILVQGFLALRAAGMLARKDILWAETRGGTIVSCSAILGIG